MLLLLVLQCPASKHLKCQKQQIHKIMLTQVYFNSSLARHCSNEELNTTKSENPPLQKFTEQRFSARQFFTLCVKPFLL